MTFLFFGVRMSNNGHEIDNSRIMMNPYDQVMGSPWDLPILLRSLQHRLSATLRLASRYLRPPAALPYGVPLTPQRLLLAQQVLSAPLTALKA